LELFWHKGKAYALEDESYQDAEIRQGDETSEPPAKDPQVSADKDTEEEKEKRELRKGDCDDIKDLCDEEELVRC